MFDNVLEAADGIFEPIVWERGWKRALNAYAPAKGLHVNRAVQ